MKMHRYRYDSGEVSVLLARAGLRLDAGETAAFLRQLEEIDARLFDVQYAELKATLLIPTKVINPGADLYTYRVFDHTGQAKRISRASEDSARVSVKGQEYTRSIESYGAGYEYSQQDLRAAALLSRPLDFSLALAARDTQARKLESVAFTGDSEVGFTGFVNNADVQLLTPITGAWPTATADQILEDMLYMERAIIANSLNIEHPDTLVLDANNYSIAVTRRLPNTAISVVDYFLTKAQGVKNVEVLPLLSTSDAGGTGPRAVMYRRDPAKLELILPIEFQQLAPEIRNYAFVVNTEMRTGGCVVRYPGSMAYMDGIGS